MFCRDSIWFYPIKIKMNELEQQKIALTKELEKVQQEINYYNLDEIAH